MRLELLKFKKVYISKTLFENSFLFKLLRMVMANGNFFVTVKSFPKAFEEPRAVWIDGRVVLSLPG